MDFGQMTLQPYIWQTLSVVKLPVKTQSSSSPFFPHPHLIVCLCLQHCLLKLAYLFLFLTVFVHCIFNLSVFSALNNVIYK